MNTKRFCASAAAISLVALALPVHAQLLGGNVNGAIGGTLSGGLRNSDVLTRGDVTGSLGAGLETDTMRRAGRAVRGTTDTAASGAQKAARKGRETARSVPGQAQNAAVGAKGSVEGAVSQAGGIAGSVDSAVTTSTSSTVKGAGHSTANAPVEQDGGGLAPLPDKVSGFEGASATGSLAQAARVDRSPVSDTAETSGKRGASLESSISADASASASR